MIRVYSTRDRRFKVLDSVTDVKLSDGISWIDVEQPTADEERTLEAQLGLDLPTREEMKDIEPSSRLYEENNANFMTATLVVNADSDTPDTTNIAFILTETFLITVRYAEPKSFRVFAAHAERQPNLCATAQACLTNLLEAIVDRTAEILEKNGNAIDSVSRQIFFHKRGEVKRNDSDALEAAINNIAMNQHITARIRESLVSLGRMISYLGLSTEMANSADARERLHSMNRDITSLTDYSSFLTDNMTFQLDAALGLISVQQNAIIKIFSVAAVIFLPPTLVASIYGMNFHHMPELTLYWGYPCALGLMVLSAVTPYWWFKKKGWL